MRVKFNDFKTIKVDEIVEIQRVGRKTKRRDHVSSVIGSRRDDLERTLKT
jgi:hypothetical protein